MVDSVWDMVSEVRKYRELNTLTRMVFDDNSIGFLCIKRTCNIYKQIYIKYILQPDIYEQRKNRESYTGTWAFVDMKHFLNVSQDLFAVLRIDSLDSSVGTASQTEGRGFEPRFSYSEPYERMKKYLPELINLAFF